MLTNRATLIQLLRNSILNAKTLTTTATATSSSRDEYFTAIHHVSNIVRKDFYMERTLNKLRITVTPELVFRVLRSCSNSPDESLRFFNWACSHHSTSYTPTSVEFEQLLNTLARHKNYNTMWKLIHQFKNPSNSTGSSTMSLSTDAVSSIIECYGTHRLVDQAVQVFNKSPSLFNCPQTVAIYNSLLFALCESKLFHGAYALIRRMIRKGVSPDKRTYSTLVNAWCSNGKMREAQQFLKEMSDNGFNPPVRGRDLLVEGLLNAGYFESAKEMMRKMVKEGSVPDVETFNVLVESVCRTGQVEFCVGLFREVCRLGMVPDVNTYKILIPAVSKAGLMDEAFRLLHNLVEDGHRPFPSLYAPIIKALCKRGQFDDAFCFFGDMKAKGHPPNRPVYTMLITMCGRGGRFVDAANYLMEMTEMGLVPISRCFDMVADGLKNCGKHDLAKRVEQLEVSIRGV
ncbi:pentatricopeptide repeat-containing protein At5g18390, mitochondrial [Arachis stenosperma]|uniref:pentatricopeptide repeat-containing protein At5g18390, mitochondrial n=1 Tax=Arachis stenosperma TaxID=217475 RepID=UPI0025AB958E|nr:pentatricopeptide repeat-containing protein At5g18390, mitochondrial [Arachis stenosperma]XP_057751033.1 pentatricopeptide repeat-containing protein At5g18390, mitochondrial [Arachis stenosperma]